MDHRDHVNLLRSGIPVTAPERTLQWADLGSGSGAFTLALAELLGDSARIISIDRDRRALAEQERAMRRQFPNARVDYRVADFTQPFDVPPFDGIVMANALHYVPPRDKLALVTRLRGHLRPGGRLLLVEYNVDSGNPWVPYPLSYSTWAALAADAGFAHTELLATVPSRFLREIYSAVSW